MVVCLISAACIITRVPYHYFDGLAQNCSISIANKLEIYSISIADKLEILQSYTKPSIWSSNWLQWPDYLVRYQFSGTINDH